jgi:formate dehydrogenase maturation protein FdhE
MIINTRSFEERLKDLVVNIDNVDILFYLFDKKEMDTWKKRKIKCLNCNSDISTALYFWKRFIKTNRGYHIVKNMCPKCNTYYAEKEFVPELNENI